MHIVVDILLEPRTKAACTPARKKQSNNLQMLWGGGATAKDYEAKMLPAILMTTFSSSLFVRQQVQAKEHKEDALRNKNLMLFFITLNHKT
jgi:hypothetical protein